MKRHADRRLPLKQEPGVDPSCHLMESVVILCGIRHRSLHENRTCDRHGQSVLMRDLAAGHVRVVRRHVEVGGAAADDGAHVAAQHAAVRRRERPKAGLHLVPALSHSLAVHPAA